MLERFLRQRVAIFLAVFLICVPSSSQSNEREMLKTAFQLLREREGVKAREIFRVLSEINRYPEAQYFYANFLEMGHYGPKDLQGAIHWTREAANAGYAPAQNEMSKYYSWGLGVPKDLRIAFDWKMKSAVQGNAGGQYRVGMAYSLGEGIIKNKKEAFYWFSLSAQQGDESAQSALGSAYRFGEGVPKDIVRAHMWYNIAASNDAMNGRENLAYTEKEMTLAQIERATEMAHRCTKSYYKNC